MGEEIRIEIESKNKGYPIFIGNSTSALIQKFIEENHKNKKVGIITDDNIKSLYENTISKSLNHLSPYLISIPAGEKNKTRETKERIEDMLLEKKYSRDTIIIAFGGGVIGDLTGFVASTYNRGISIIHVPTTLLAMVDSSIGGKTGVDTKYGKNLIGTIHQPDAVFIDLNFLNSLPKEDFLNGMSEIIKIAITSDKGLFEFIEKNSKEILEKEENTLLYIIKRSIELKKEIIERDEEESGLRQTLNFGHTFGHAFENYSEYKIKHGFCISRGIAVESKISVLTENLKREEEKRIVSLLDKFSLPNKINEDINPNKIIDIMKVDKKTRNQKPRFVILKEIGRIKTKNKDFSFEIKEDIIKKAIETPK